MASVGQVQPIGFVQLRADEEVEVPDSLILSDKRGSQPEFAVGFGDSYDLQFTQWVCQWLLSSQTWLQTSSAVKSALGR